MSAPEIIKLKNVRIVYPNLVVATRPKDYPNSPPMFSCDLLIKKNDPIVATIMERVQELATEQWKANAANVMQLIYNDKKARSFGNGNERMTKKFERMGGYDDDIFYISAKSGEDRPPQIGRSDGSIIDMRDTEERLEHIKAMFSGCYVNAIIKPWLRIKNPGVSFELLILQYVKKGTPLGTSAPDLTGMLDAVEPEEVSVEGIPGFAAPSTTPGKPSWFGDNVPF
jgi:hypothetical protein